MKIGLTGSIACGKSTVSDYLGRLGYFVADADAISHALTAPGGLALPALRAAFGDGVFDGDALNRRALGALVFSDSEKRAQLNAILHPMIIAQMNDELSAHDAPDTLVFGDVPLLYECGMEAMFGRVWVVSTSAEIQLERLMIRDHLSREEALARIQAQMPLEEKRRRADAVIDSSGTLSETRRQIDRLIASMASIASISSIASI